MRTHLQGFLLLGLLAAAVWGAARLASPTLGDAFGEDGGFVAESGEDLVELTIAGETLEAELTADEIIRLQFQLVLAGFLEGREDVDGMFGPATERAVTAAAAEWDLPTATPRAVLEHSDTLYADDPFFAAP